MRIEHVLIGIILMVVVLLVVIGMLTGAIPVLEDFISNMSVEPWK